MWGWSYNFFYLWCYNFYIEWLKCELCLILLVLSINKSSFLLKMYWYLADLPDLKHNFFLHFKHLLHFDFDSPLVKCITSIYCTESAFIYLPSVCSLLQSTQLWPWVGVDTITGKYHYNMCAGKVYPSDFMKASHLYPMLRRAIEFLKTFPM